MAKSKLLDCDPAEVTPAQAGAAFAAEAQRIAAENGSDMVTAWRKARELHPGVHSRMMEGHSETAAAIANEAPRQPTRARITEISREYAGLFRQAMERTNGDPVKSHALVMRTLKPAASALANSIATAPSKSAPAVAPVALANSASNVPEGAIALTGPVCEAVDSKW